MSSSYDAGVVGTDQAGKFLAFSLAENGFDTPVIERGGTRWGMKGLVGAESDQVFGASMFGIEGGEIASVLQLAGMGDRPYQRLRDGIFCIPRWPGFTTTFFPVHDDFS